MAEQRTPHLVCYDIRDDRRLRCTHRTLLAWGLRLQYSIFLCPLTPRERYRLTEVLRRVIDERVDDLRIYSLEPQRAIHYQGRYPVPDGLIVPGVDLIAIDEAGSGANIALCDAD